MTKCVQRRKGEGWGGGDGAGVGEVLGSCVGGGGGGGRDGAALRPRAGALALHSYAQRGNGSGVVAVLVLRGGRRRTLRLHADGVVPRVSRVHGLLPLRARVPGARGAGMLASCRWRWRMLDLDGLGDRHYRVYILAGEANADIPCPTACGGKIRWAEAGFMPGHRICEHCGRRYRVIGPAALALLRGRVWRYAK